LLELARGSTSLYAELHRSVDRLLLTRVLAHTKGNHREASRVLGIARQTMRTKLRALGEGMPLTHDQDDDLDP